VWKLQCLLQSREKYLLNINIPPGNIYPSNLSNYLEISSNIIKMNDDPYKKVFVSQKRPVCRPLKQRHASLEFVTGNRATLLHQ